ncbi:MULTISPECIES: dihydrofolate reductase family protein [unclassified Salinibacterium]|uniref:dihydrofolate reductase family protein n=1 Tax=unclassified Salinibacterium TaxID=2632331 RepID=UPI0014231ADD|nr:MULTISPECIES: dihydrofolate reductase family protein [unclassified Salinibacterium]
MTRTHYYTASTLDGFIATRDHSLDWLLKQPFDEHGPMNYESFVADIGALIMGASTYAWVLEHDAGWSYTQPAFVLTHREFPVPDGADVRFRSGDVAAVHAEVIAAAEGRDVWVVGGGDLAGQFADAGLLDEVWVQFAPVTIAEGQPLLPRSLDLELVDHARNGGFLCARYRVVTPAE